MQNILFFKGKQIKNHTKHSLNQRTTKKTTEFHGKYSLIQRTTQTKFHVKQSLNQRTTKKQHNRMSCKIFSNSKDNK